MQDYLYATQEKNLNDYWNLDNETFDKRVLLDTIILDASTLGVNTTNPLQYYTQCRMWWNKWKDTFQAWFDVLDEEYEPLWNTDRFEESHDDTVDKGYVNVKTHDKEVMDDDTTSKVNTTADSSMTSDGTANTTNSVSAFDAGDTLQTHDASSTTTHDATTTHSTSETTGNATDDRTTTSDGTSDEDNGNDRDYDHKLHAWGNIGVMSSQDLATQEIKLRFFNTYEHIAAIFIKEMTCAVW